jgi:arylsulfatase A-like enzyme
VNQPSARQLIAIAVWLGLAYGLIEAAALRSLAFVPIAAAPLNGTTFDILWFDPLVYAAVFAAIAVLILVLRTRRPSVDWERALVFLLISLGVFLIVDFQDHRLANYASAVIGAGAGWQAARYYARHRAAVASWVARTLPMLAGLVIVAALVVVGGRRFGEARTLSARTTPSPRPPNVVLLVMDTVRADRMSLYGYGRPTTPKLAAWAAAAVVFDRAHSTSSWTLPSHASIMTGRMPREHHAGDPRRPFLDGALPTLAEAFDRAGYATGGFSANTYWAARHVGLARGFTHFEDYFRSGRDAVFRPVLGRKIGWELAPKFGVGRITERARADAMNARLLAWLNQIGDRPFFAFVNYMDAHGPYLAPPPYATQFSPTAAESANREEAILSPTNDSQAARLSERVKTLSDAYDGALSYLDVMVTDLVDALDRRGLADNTIIVVTSDHGESFGEQGRVSHGNSVFLEQTHVPLIVRLPQHKDGGRREPRPVSLSQLPATLLALTGQPRDEFPGTSIFETATEPGPIVTEVARRLAVPTTWPSSRGWQRAVVTDRWHFVLGEKGDRYLYDLSADPGEQQDLSGRPEWSSLVADFTGRLSRPAATGAGAP